MIVYTCCVGSTYNKAECARRSECAFYLGNYHEDKQKKIKSNMRQNGFDEINPNLCIDDDYSEYMEQEDV